MKIKDIVQEGFLDTLGTIGRGVASSFGVESNPQAQELKAMAAAEKETRPKLPGMAAKQFKQLLANSGADLSDPASYDADAVTQSLKNYAVQYFASANRSEVNRYITNAIDNIPLPANLTDQDILQYLSKANDARSAGVDAALQGRLNQIQTRNAAPETPQQTTTSTATTSSPQPAQTTYSTTVPPAPKGYINTLDIAGRKFYFNRGDWYEYHGQMWPKDIDVAQKVKDVDQLAPYIEAGYVKQERYGTKKKK